MRTPIATQIKIGLRKQGQELTNKDVGILLSVLQGFGLVQKNDVGKRVWLRSYGIVMENTKQRDIRKKLHC